MHPIAEKYAEDFGKMCAFMVTHPNATDMDFALFMSVAASAELDEELDKAMKDPIRMHGFICGILSYFDEFKSANVEIMEKLMRDGHI